MTVTFHRMDEASREDWIRAGEANQQWQVLVSTRVVSLLRQLAARIEGQAIDQLQHSLQAATRAERAGAAEDMIVAALCHDMADAISTENHGAIAAEILKPYVAEGTYHIIRTHQDFQGRYYRALFGGDDAAHLAHAGEAWYQDACRFSEEWDQCSFDPQYDTFPLEHFIPLLDRVFARPRSVPRGFVERVSSGVNRRMRRLLWTARRH